MPLADALTFAVLRAQARRPALSSVTGGVGAVRLEYGAIRKWGSAAFIGGNLAAGLMLSLTGVAAIPYGLAASALLSVGAALYAAPLGALAHAPQPGEAERSNGGGLGLLILVIGAATLISGEPFAAQHVRLAALGARGPFECVRRRGLGARGHLETACFALVGRWSPVPIGRSDFWRSAA